MKLESTVSASIDTIRAELARTKLIASTMNLVVWIDDPDRRAWVLERAEMLGEKHPSFTLVFDCTGTCAGDATIVTSSRDVLSHFTVQGERVVIDVSCASPGEIGEYVAALCSPTVPTVLWWSGKTLGGDAFTTLLRSANKLVVDASGAHRDASFLRDLAAFRATHPELELRDRAWMRLRPWQDMIAQFFDDPNLVGELFSITGLHISSGSDAEAFYLAAWLASRLGWEASGRDAFRDRNGRTVTFSHEREGEIRRVQRVCLDSSASWYHGTVAETPDVVRVWVEGEHARAPRLFTLSQIDNASLLEQAILERGADELFETALRGAGTLLG